MSPLRDALRRQLARLHPQTVHTDLSPLAERLPEIEGQRRALAGLDDDTLRRRAEQLRQRARQGEGEESLTVEVFALVCETARRTVSMSPFEVQILAALGLLRGKVVEMQTGEGKTLAAVLPAVLRALTGRGVHILTFNDYLARRDAAWMGPIYQQLGLSVGCVQEGMPPERRRDEYAADLTYLTAQEAGFDFLRDQLVTEVGQRVHRPFHCAIVDEADCLLIDEARVPLVIAASLGNSEESAIAELDTSRLGQVAAVVKTLQPGRHFRTDRQSRDISLSDEGLDQVEQELACGDLMATEQSELLAAVHCALYAQVLLQRDVHYILRQDRIQMVDEHTGRVVKDRHWPDGLQAALETKEGLRVGPGGRILGSVTLQQFLVGYRHLCGMTGTASDAAEELQELYGLGVLRIPTHRPAIRIDHPDLVFTHRQAKEEALITAVRDAHQQRRPVLVGTQSVDESQRLGLELQGQGIPCQILNAKHDQREAEIVAEAGRPGAVTIATNMAGRGTDIRLGGPEQEEREAVFALGGLLVLSSQRHESRRVDLQLRGRAGRQGDPGETRCYVSLDDELLAQHGIDRSLQRWLPDALRLRQRSEALDHPFLHREVRRAQRISESHNRELRSTLWRYGQPIEEQRQDLQEQRESTLLGHDAPSPEVFQSPAYRQLLERLEEAEVEQLGARLGWLPWIEPGADTLPWRPNCGTAATWRGWGARTP